jgi:GDP-4-dehydro-6-deoxy-D-mannose reductase
MDARAGAGGAGPLTGPPLVTGGGGFAGSHLVALLAEQGEEPAAPPRSEVDLLDPEAARAALRRLQPGTIFHLAGLASVSRAWEEPREVLQRNLGMTLNLLEAARAERIEAPLLLVCSGEAYGPPERLPITEDAPLRPQNPYAVSKAACDLLGGQYADSYGLRVVRARPFNHAGPGQSEDFVVGTLTRQVAEAELEGRERCVLRMGNLDSARDFTDVRDVVRAYAYAIELEPGAYNVCSGRSVQVRELVGLLQAAAEIEVDVEVDPERVRANEVPDIQGSAEKLRAATGWQPEIPLERTVADALAAWRERLAVGARHS